VRCANNNVGIATNGALSQVLACRPPAMAHFQNGNKVGSPPGNGVLKTAKRVCLLQWIIHKNSTVTYLLRRSIMTRISTLWPALLLTLSAHTAFAQSTPSQAPPKLEKIEEIADDAITVTAKPGQESKITEKRDNSGNVTEATVKSGPSTYTLKPNRPPGSSVPGEVNRGAQWTVMEFDIGKKKKTTKEDDGSTDTTAPPPPPAVK
jgi:hypothetical protein